MNHVYCIYNKKSNKFYIGSTVNLNRRKREHFRLLEKNKHHSIKLQNSYNKHGRDNFIFTILKVCVDEKFWEQYYLDKYKPKYNVSLSSNSPMKGRTHSKKTLKKLKNRPVPRGKEHYMSKRGPTNEHKNNMSLARKGSRRTDETRKKMSRTAKRINSISRIDRDKQKKSIKDNMGNIFESLSSASSYHKIPVQTICDNLKGRSKLVRGRLKFEYT